jgi:hypothetical protein
MNDPMSFDGLEGIPDPFAEAASRATEPAPMKPLAASIGTPPTRAQMKVARIGALALLLASTLGVLASVSARGAQALVAIAIPLCAAAWTLVALFRSTTKRPPVGTLLVVGLASFAVSAIATAGPGDSSVAAMTSCFTGTCVLAAALATPAVYGMRRSFVSGAFLRTSAIGLAAGLVGAGATRAHCPNDALVHVLGGHGIPVMIAIAAVAAIGARFTRI